MVSCEMLSALRSLGAFGKSSAVLHLTTLLCIPRPEVETVATWMLYMVAFSRLVSIRLSVFASTVNREAGRCQVEVGA